MTLIWVRALITSDPLSNLTHLGVESLGGCPPLTDVSSGQRALEREIQQLGSLQFPNSTHQTLGKS